MARLHPGASRTTEARRPPERGPVVLAHLQESPLVGRDREEDLCRHLVGQVTGGQAACLAISGESGVGKTRLARSILNRLAGQGWQVGMARAGELTARVPFWLAHQSFPELADITGALEPVAGAVERDPDGVALARVRLVERLIATLSSTVASPGTAVLWDDAAWGDPSSLEALPHILDALASRPLLIVLTVTLDGLNPDHPLERALYRLDRGRALVRLPLARLSPEHTVALGEAIISGPLPAPLRERLVDDTKGNPFFIEETIRALVDHGSLTWSGTTWEYTRPGPALISQGLRAAITQRLAGLPTETRDGLRAAAVLGRSFSLDAIALVLESTPRQVDALLRPAVSSGVVEAVGDGFEFAHDQIRNLLYEALPLIDRRELHLAAARALEALGDADITAIPYHWRKGGDLEAAIVGELAASEAALSEAGLLEALARRETAVRMASAREINPQLRMRALEALGDLQRHLTPLRATAAYRDALSGTGSDGPDRDRLWRKLKISQSLGGDLRAASELAPPTDPDHRAQAQAAKAYNLALQGDVAGARHLLEESAAARAPDIICLSDATEAILAYLTGERDTCLRKGRLAYDLSVHELPRRQPMLRYTAAWQLLRSYLAYQADIGEPLDALLRDEVDLATRSGSEMIALSARSVRGQIAFWRGDWETAAQHFDAAEESAAAAEHMLARPVLSFFAPAFWIATDDLDRARSVLEGACEPLWQSGLAAGFGTIPVLVSLATIDRLQANPVSARRRLEEADSLRSPATVCVDSSIDLEHAEVAISEGNVSAARAHLDEALARATSHGDLRTRLEVHRLLGSLGDERSKNFQHAADLAERVGSPWLEYRVLNHWASLAELPALRRRRLAALRARLRAGPGLDRAGHATLTAREIEVLRDLAEGLSTHEIADHLCISEKTVQRHVANVYMKIDVHNRVAAMRYYETHFGP